MPQGKYKNPQYGLRIPADVMNKLKYIAEYNGRSANKEIEQLILAHISSWESQKGAIDLSGFQPRRG
jgi:hypothetical protein